MNRVDSLLNKTRESANKVRLHARPHVVLHTMALFALFLAMALLGRIPALLHSDVYGLHALLVALPYSFVTSVYVCHSHRIAPAVGALSLLGVVLGTIHPTMALACLAPAIAAAATWKLLHGSPLRPIIASACMGAIGYPATIAKGLLSGSLIVGDAEGSIRIASLVILCCALALLGSLIANKTHSGDQAKAY